MAFLCVASAFVVADCYESAFVRSESTLFKIRARKKPVEVEAMQWGVFAGRQAKCIEFIGDSFTWIEPLSPMMNKKPGIKTLEGVMEISLNDYIIKGVNGELYPCKEDIFHKTYDIVSD